MPRNWTLDTLAKQPHFERAFDAFEREQGRPIRLGPPPRPVTVRPFAVRLLCDNQPVLDLRFQTAPPDLSPGELFNAALRHLAEFTPGTVAHGLLATFCEYSQDWHAKEWEAVLRQLGVPMQAAEKALRDGFEVNVNRMKG